MAQTTSTKEKQPPLEKYNRATRIKQRIIWLYSRGIETNGQEGLSPKGVVGGVTDYSICGNVKYHLTQKKFTHQAKACCQVALDLFEESVYIKEPILPPPPGKNNVEGEKEEEEAPTGPEAIEIEVENSDDEYEEEEVEVEEGFKTPSPKKKKATPTPRMSKQKRTPVVKSKTEMSIDDLTKQFDGTSLEGIPAMASAGLGFPVLCGRYTKEKRVSPFKLETNSFILIRMIPHNCLTARMVTLEWTDDRTLVLTIKWPSFFWKIGNHVQFQKDSTAPAEFHFPEDHIVFNSVARYLEQRADLTDEQHPKVFDKIVFKFDNPMDSTFGISEVLTVVITDADLDKAAGEVLPDAGSIKVHQLILKEKQPEDGRKKTIKTSARKTKTGKSVDPDGSKVSEDKESTEAFDYNRFTSLYKYHGRLPLPPEVIAGFKGVEENLFYLVNFSMENDKSLLDGDFINQVMTQFDGRPTEMMEHVEEYVADAASTALAAMVTDDNDDLSASPSITLPPPRSPQAGPRLQLTDGGPPAVIEATAMDTREINAKRKHAPLTRAQSQKNVESTGN